MQSYQPQATGHNANQNYNIRSGQQGYENNYRNSIGSNAQISIAAISAAVQQGHANSKVQSLSKNEHNTVNQQPQLFLGVQQKVVNQPQSFSGYQYSPSNQQPHTSAGNQQQIKQQPQTVSGKQQVSPFPGIQQGAANRPIQSFSGTQQNYAPIYNTQQIQKVPMQSVPQLQVHNTYQNNAHNVTALNQQPFHSTITQANQQQTAGQRLPLRQEQSNYKAESSSGVGGNSNEYRNERIQYQNVQSKDNFEELRQIISYPALALDDTNEAKKVPLVLITIHKNKNTSGNNKSKAKKKTESMGKYSHGPQTGNAPITSNRDSSESTSHLHKQSPNVLQNSNVLDNRQPQNSGQASSFATQGNNAQIQMSPFQEQTLHQKQNQGGFIPLTPYRYPALEGRKMLPTEWKPVDKISAPAQGNHNANQNSGYLQSSINQQGAFVQGQQRNLGYSSPTNVSPVSSLPQNTALNYNNVNASPQHASRSSTYNQQASPNQNKTDNLNHQLTLAPTQQANFNQGFRPVSMISQPNIGTQNYLVNNAQRSGENFPQQQAHFPQFTTGNGMQQHYAKNDSTKHLQDLNEGLRQPNTYPAGSVGAPSIMPGTKHGMSQTSKDDIPLQSTSQTGIVSNYNPPVRQNTNMWTVSQNADQNVASQYLERNSGFIKNNELLTASNVQTNINQNGQSAAFPSQLNPQPVSSVNGNTANAGQQVSGLNYQNSHTRFPQTGNLASSQQQLNNAQINMQGSLNTGYNTVPSYVHQNKPGHSNNFQNNMNTITLNSPNVTPNQSPNKEPANNVYASDQNGRNNLFQKSENNGGINYGQSNGSPNNFNTNYEAVQSQNAFQGSSYGTMRSVPTNNQNNQQQTVYPSSREHNQAYGMNNHQSSNYGSSETQNSVIGMKPDGSMLNDRNCTKNHPLQYAASSNMQPSSVEIESNDKGLYSPNLNQLAQFAYSETGNLNGDGNSKETNIGGNNEPPPEALLLVLVSAKKSAIEQNPDRERDDSLERYESAPSELVELLSEDANRKMIFESFNEAKKKIV